MNPSFYQCFKLFITGFSLIVPIYATCDLPTVMEAPVVGEETSIVDPSSILKERSSEYKGRITCKKLKRAKVYTNDARFVPYCNDALKGCFIQEELDKLPKTHPLHQELGLKLTHQMAFNFSFCEVAILTYAPKLYNDEFKR